MTAGRPRSSWTSQLFRPIDNAWLVFFRVAFSGIMLVEALRFLSSNKIAAAYMDPQLHFKYYGFEWVHPWPGVGMVIHFIALGVLSLMMAVGFLYRIAATLFFLGFTYLFLLDQARYLNHFYLVCLLALLMVFLPAHHACSLDARLRPKLRRDTVPAWTLFLVRAQIGIVYFYAGLAKLNGDWLRGEPLHTWLARRDYPPFLDELLAERGAALFLSYSGLTFDLLLAPALLWRRTRVAAFTLALAFHLSNVFLFSIGIFPWLMIAATALFLAPDFPRRLGLLPRLEDPAPAVPSDTKPWVVGVLAVYLLVQLLFPLRHHLYPGNVAWTEEGHRFSWRMKLRVKQGWVRFQATDPDTGRGWVIDPRDILTPRQERKMSRIPDMILQFAHHLAEVERSRGHPNVEIRALAFSTLNGRPHQQLIDPEVNLAAVTRSLKPASWILPLP